MIVQAKKGLDMDTTSQSKSGNCLELGLVKPGQARDFVQIVIAQPQNDINIRIPRGWCERRSICARSVACGWGLAST